MLVAVGCELVEMAKTYCYKNITTEKLNNISCHVVSRDWVGVVWCFVRKHFLWRI